MMKREKVLKIERESTQGLKKGRGLSWGLRKSKIRENKERGCEREEVQESGKEQKDVLFVANGK